MPCKDVTERIRVAFDDQDCLADYFYRKRTCGQGVGAGNLLLDAFRGKDATWFLDADPVALIDAMQIADELEEFLAYKHFFAVQGAVEVLLGKAAGIAGKDCIAAEVGYDYASGETVIEGEIPVDLLTEKIRSCGGCKGCGKSAKPVFN